MTREQVNFVLIFFPFHSVQCSASHHQRDPNGEREREGEGEGVGERAGDPTERIREISVCAESNSTASFPIHPQNTLTFFVLSHGISFILLV